ncbi:hypothetical protein FS827_22365 [Agrobacterium vitis]|nr:hypothetical protein [Allorhizobium ampelinum]
MPGENEAVQFPAGLLEWAGHRSGGVRRLFDQKSGWSSEGVLETNLLSRLAKWASMVRDGDPQAARVILLVGGPGNGKTEAIETTVRSLDRALGCAGQLIDHLSERFRPNGEKVPRRVEVEAGELASPRRALRLSIVQDATVVFGFPGRSPASLLREELTRATEAGATDLYLCCVNRGVLDDALIEAIDREDHRSRVLLERVCQAVSVSPGAPSCWPLSGYPEVVVWPMDMDSLFTETDDGQPAPYGQIFARALDASRWPEAGACEAGPRCPFCGSRVALARNRQGKALHQMLRYFEVGSGKRWSFRDVFSLMSYLLAGHREEASRDDGSPCAWAASQIKLDDAQRGSRPNARSATSIYRLVAAQYQHALFHGWDKGAGNALLRDLGELGLRENHTAMGLAWFLSSRRSQYLPTMISGLLDGIDQLLDPALASPDTEVAVTSGTTFRLRELDTRFSRSVAEGLDFVRKTRVLTLLETHLLDRLSEVDVLLSQQQVRRKKPAVATRVQRVIRDFSCRIVRRSIGARTGAVRDAEILAEFQHIVEDKGDDALFDVARQVEQLLNKGQNFEVSLTTTFGQPLPPPSRRATLVVQRRHVQPPEVNDEGRPRAPLQFLEVGEGHSAQKIALTYELFKAVREIERGMSKASLPRAVLALLDTTGAKLGGPIVRDASVLPRAEMKLGPEGLSVQLRRNGFGIMREGGR